MARNSKRRREELEEIVENIIVSEEASTRLIKKLFIYAFK